MARKFDIDTPARIGGLLEALAGITVTGNGSITGTLSVGSTMTVTGKLTLTAGIAGALILDTQASATGHAVRADRTISTGAGLTGGGDLTANRSLAVDFTGSTGISNSVARVDHNHDAVYLAIGATAADSSKLGGVAAASYVQNTRQVIAGTGLTGGGTLAADRTISVDFGTGNTQAARGDHNHDSVYAKLSGASFTGAIVMSSNSSAIIGLTLQGATSGWASGIQFDNTTATTGKKYGIYSDSTGNWNFTLETGGVGSLLQYNGTAWSTTKNFTSSGTINGSTLQEGGTNLSSKYVPQTVSVTAGSGLTGGGALSASRTLSVDFGTGATQVAAGNHNHDSVYAKLSGATFSRSNFGIAIDGGTGWASLRLGANGADVLVGKNLKTTDGTWTTDDTTQPSQGIIMSSDGSINFYYRAANTANGVGTQRFKQMPDGTTTITGATTITGTLNATTVQQNGQNIDSRFVPLGRNVSAGSGLTGGGTLAGDITISHADTSSQGNFSLAQGQRVSAMTFDTYGHVISVTTGDNNVLDAIDNGRATKPVDTAGGGLSFVFNTIAGMTGATSGTQFADVLVLNSYVDASGGQVNALAFDKNAMQIFHYQAGQAATSWGTAKTLSYTDHNHNGVYVPVGRSISAGAGLTGGGDLSADRSLAVNFTASGGNNGTGTTVARGDHNHDSRYALGTGNIAPANLNTATTSGFYRLNNAAAHTNFPTGVDWGQLIVAHGNGDTIAQIAMDYGSGYIYYRSGNPTDVGGTGAWSAWRRLYHTGNITSGTATPSGGIDGDIYLQYV
jgi:hypothetical protein